MDWIWIVCAIVGAWACLRVIGAERERRIFAIKAEIASRPPPPSPLLTPPADPAPAAPPAAKNPWAAKLTPPVRPKAVR